jgi:mannose-1-phosphate guanylyltransferase
MRLIPVILAGGRGERFWPLSRRARPKQLLPLLSDRALLADTLERLSGLAGPESAWVLTAQDLVAAVRGALPAVPATQVVGEPIGKNTAPAIGLAAWWHRDAGDDAVLAVLPSDHRIEPALRFREELVRAANVALDRRAIVAFGVPPTRPETGYGYIEAGAPIAPGSEFHAVARFHEKPDAKTAEGYLAAGRYLWNSGMFVFPPRVMLEEIAAHQGDLAALLRELPDAPGPGTEAEIARFYLAAPSISIDYAVMERSTRALVARAGFAWDDLGSWAALGADRTRDGAGNVARGRALLEDCKDVIAFADGGLVAALGVEGLVIVRTGDVTLVVPRERAQEVRRLVERLAAEEGLGGYR